MIDLQLSRNQLSRNQLSPKLISNLKLFKCLNQKGQGLIEYLIIVALMSVATIGIMRTLNQAVKAKFSSSIYAIQGVQKKAEYETLDENEYKKTDFSNFMNGAASKSNK